MNIIECTEQHLECAAGLFNLYRIFYEQESDLAACREFITDNFEQKRSRIFLLFDDAGKAVGFSQLYPTYGSIAMRPFYYLSDLYVDKSCRQKGYAKHLMTFLTERFTAEGAQRLTLDTATSNKIAQHLYESLGYEQEQAYITYHQMLKAG
jgi:ribosomal protein S18 acetylase RimI-like enzyme